MGPQRPKTSCSAPEAKPPVLAKIKKRRQSPTDTSGPQPYFEPKFEFSGEGECSHSAALGFVGGWPHAQAKPWGSGMWRTQAAPGTTRGLRHPSSAIPQPRPELPWNQMINDPATRAARAKKREDKRDREGNAIRSGANIKMVWPKPWLSGGALIQHNPPPGPMEPFVGEGYSRALQNVKRTHGSTVKEVLGTHSVVCSPSVAQRLVSDRSSSMYHMGDKYKDSLYSFDMKNSPTTPRLKVARDRMVTPPPGSEYVRAKYTQLGAPQPTIMAQQMQPLEPPELKGVGLFRDHRLQRSRHGLLAHASGDQLAQCFKAAAQVARNSGTGGQEFKEEHSPDLTKTDPLPPPPPREAPVPATGWAAPDTPELGPAPPAAIVVPM